MLGSSRKGRNGWSSQPPRGADSPSGNEVSVEDLVPGDVLRLADRVGNFATVRISKDTSRAIRNQRHAGSSPDRWPQLGDRLGPNLRHPLGASTGPSAARHPAPRPSWCPVAGGPDHGGWHVRQREAPAGSLPSRARRRDSGRAVKCPDRAESLEPLDQVQECRCRGAWPASTLRSSAKDIVAC